MEPDPFDSDLQTIVDYAQKSRTQFVQIHLCLYMIRDYYRENHDHINPRRWRVARIVKFKNKTTKYKHEFIVARLELHGDVRYLTLERMKEKSRDAGPGLRISAPLNGARILSEDDPADRPGNVTLMSLVPSAAVAAAQMSLPDVLVLASHIHGVAPKYKPFGSNCFWFADAMVKAVRHHGFIVEQEHPQSTGMLSKLKELVFHSSVATEEETNNIYAEFAITRVRFFNFQQSLYAAGPAALQPEAVNTP